MLAPYLNDTLTMPNKTGTNKKRRTATRRRPARISQSADSVKALLERSPLSDAIAAHGARQRHWQRWLAARLPAQLLAYVTGIVERDAELVIFTASAAWGVRLRYALAEVETELRSAAPELERVVVRVMPAKRGRT
jgi:hypothetical protein